MRSQILDILNRYASGITLSEAIEAAREIETLSPALRISGEVTDAFGIAQMTVWAERNFSASDRERKIQCIKVLRDRYGCGLKVAKEIMDNVQGSANYSYLR